MTRTETDRKTESEESLLIGKQSTNLFFFLSLGPSKPPALRMFCLGNRGAGKTTLGVWLAKQLGIFHIKFREQLQMVIVAKNGQRVPYSDEVESKEDLTTQIKQARRAAADEEEEEEEKEDTESQEVGAFLHPCVTFTFDFWC